MEVDVVHSVDWLARQAGRVEVVDVRHLRVEDIERLEHESRFCTQAITDLTVPKRGALRCDTGILDQRSRPKVPTPKTAEERSRRFDREPGGDDAIERPRHTRSRTIIVRQPGASE